MICRISRTAVTQVEKGRPHLQEHSVKAQGELINR